MIRYSRLPRYVFASVTDEPETHEVSEQESEQEEKEYTVQEVVAEVEDIFSD